MKIFLSSTCYDLLDARPVLEQHFISCGYTPLLSERTTFPVDPGRHRHRVCIETARTADLFVLIVDRVYGTPYVDDAAISVTHAEFRAAAAGEVPIMTFVRSSVWNERNTHKKNPTLAPVFADTVKVFTFLNEVQAHPHGMWIAQFDDVTKIVSNLDALRDTNERNRNHPTEEQALHDHYSSADGHPLRPFSVDILGERRTTTFYTKSEWLHLHVPVKSVVCTLDRFLPEPPVDADTAYGKLVEARLRLCGVKLWNDRCYRLVDYSVNNSSIQFTFGNTRFFPYRFSAGLMSDELIDAAREYSVEQIVRRRSELLPNRQRWMPTTESIGRPSDRLCAGGVAVLLALARKNERDFLVPLHVRSAEVAENRGFASVSFNGYHQCYVDQLDETHIRWSVFRELYEELFGGEGVKRPSRHVKHDWYFREQCIGYFTNEPYICEMLGFGFNCVVGNWECGILLAVENEAYWERFGDTMVYSWEAKREPIIRCSTRRAQDWRDALQRTTWAGDSLFCLWAGLRRLQQTFPDRFDFSVDELMQPCA